MAVAFSDLGPGPRRARPKKKLTLARPPLSAPSRCRTARHSRSSGRSCPPRPLSLELSLEFIRDDEAVEVTPQSILLRKVELSASKRQTLASRAKRERTVTAQA
jgi:hypothetical protein